MGRASRPDRVSRVRSGAATPRGRLPRAEEPVSENPYTMVSLDPLMTAEDRERSTYRPDLPQRPLTVEHDPLRHDDLRWEAEGLAEALDAFRERLIAADFPDSVIGMWAGAASLTWDAVNSIEVGDD